LTAAAALATFVLLPRLGETPPVTRRIQIGTAIALVLAAFVGLDFAVGDSHGAPIGSYTTKDAYTYVSAPAVHPPVVTSHVSTAASNLAPGYIMLANFYDLNYPPMVGQSGPLILDDSL